MSDREVIEFLPAFLVGMETVLGVTREQVAAGHNPDPLGSTSCWCSRNAELLQLTINDIAYSSLIVTCCHVVT